MVDRMEVSVCPSVMEGIAEDRESVLVEQAKHNREAFAVLYRRHYRMLSTYVFRRTGDIHVAEDLVADVFVIVLRTLPRYRCRGVPLRFWLLRIATNTVNRWARRQRGKTVATQSADLLREAIVDKTSPPDQLDQQHARRALLMLSPKHQAVLSLHYFEGLAVKQVAAVLGCRVGTVKSRLARGRQALRNELNRRR